MALNENISIENLDTGAKNAFRGNIEKVLLPKNHRLYKMTWGLDLNKVTAWWSSVEPLTSNDLGFHGAWNHPLGIQNYTRINAAVSLGWNKLENIVTIRLKTPVYGFVGKCERQPADNEKDIRKEKFNTPYLGGGHIQVYVPNLKAEDIELMK